MLGFFHVDNAERSHMCGCGSAAAPCDAQPDSQSLMHSTVRTREHSCLTRDDVDGAQTRYGGDCLATSIVCQTLHVGSRGAGRLGVALAYALAIACAAVSLLSWCVSVRRRLAPSAHRVTPT